MRFSLDKADNRKDFEKKLDKAISSLEDDIEEKKNNISRLIKELDLEKAPKP